MKYYKARVKLGHMGRRKYIESTLYLEAENLIAAMDRAKGFPGVKHSKLPEVFEITKEEYDKGIQEKPYSKMMKNIELKTM